MKNIFQYILMFSIPIVVSILTSCTQLAVVEWIPENIKWYQSIQEADSNRYALLLDSSKTRYMNPNPEDTNTYYWASDTVLMLWTDGTFAQAKKVVQLKLVDGPIIFNEFIYDPIGYGGSGNIKFVRSNYDIKYQHSFYGSPENKYEIITPGTPKSGKITLINNDHEKRVIYKNRSYVPVLKNRIILRY